MEIRNERPEDADAIRRVTKAAFEGAAYSDQTEADIVEALRTSGSLTLFLVAAEAGEIIGHAAFSPVRINGAGGGWLGLGPVSVRPDRQGRGVGDQLVRAGLREIERLNAEGCVVFGDPGYYGRFGFAADPRLVYAGAPPGYFQRLLFRGNAPAGEVTYHSSFGGA